MTVEDLKNAAVFCAVSPNTAVDDCAMVAARFTVLRSAKVVADCLGKENALLDRSASVAVEDSDRFVPRLSALRSPRAAAELLGDVIALRAGASRVVVEA